MLCLIKNENIFDKFCKNVYTIEYQKRGLPHMHLLVFLYLTDQFLEISQIDEVICAKLLTLETNPTGKLIKIITSIMFYCPCRNINLYSPCISNAQDDLPKYIKCYPCNFLEETSIHKISYSLY